MKILINDLMQISDAPSAIKTPALSDIYRESSFEANFDEEQTVNCIGIGYTDATEITIKQNNPFESAVINLPLISDALDISGNRNNGTATDITWTAEIANFNGTSSNIAFSSPCDLTTGSIYFKVKRGLIGTWENIASNARDGIYAPYGGYNIRIDSTNKIFFELRSSTTIYQSVSIKTNFTDTTSFHDVCVTFDGTRVKCYFDNILTNDVIQTVQIAPGAYNLHLGKLAYGLHYFFSGSLSNFYIFNRALTTAEIESLYNGNMSQSISLTPRTESTRKYNNGLYILDEINGTKYEISHNGNFIGRAGIGVYRTLGTSPTKEIGFYTTTENRVTLSGQTIPGAGGYYGRRIDLDVRYKIDKDIYTDIEKAYVTQIMKEYPYFLLLDNEQHKVPPNMLRFYAATDKPLSLLQSSTYKFLYSYKFSFWERF